MSKPPPARYRTTNWSIYNDAQPCCMDLVQDSLRTVRCIAGLDDPTCPNPLSHVELAILQRRGSHERGSPTVWFDPAMNWPAMD